MSTELKPTTFADLWEMPLEKLFAYVIADKKAEVRYIVSLLESRWLKLRFGSIPLAMGAVSKLRGFAATRLRAAVALITFINLLDHIIDPGDCTPNEDVDPRAYFEQASWVVITLRNPELMADEVAFPVMAGLIYAYRVCRDLLGIDATEQMNYIWELFTPDAERMLAGEVFANPETIEMARSSYFECVTLTLWITGLPIDVVRDFVRLAQPLLYSDTFADFVHDLIDRNVQIPGKEFDEAGIDRDLLIKCESWEDLADLAGFADWFTRFAGVAEAQWLATRPAAVATLLPHVQSVWGRYFMWRRLTHMGRDLTWAKLRFAEFPALEGG